MAVGADPKELEIDAAVRVKLRFILITGEREVGCGDIGTVHLRAVEPKRPDHLLLDHVAIASRVIGRQADVLVQQVAVQSGKG